jgi:hypothetical protein
MDTFFKHIKSSIRGLWIYSLCFILIFNIIFFSKSTDSSETSGMFILISFFLQILTFILFPFTIVVVSYVGFKTNRIIMAIVLFLIGEIAILLLTGNVSLFGLFENSPPNVSKDLQEELLVFHKNRDFALSVSNLISSAIYYVAMSLNKEKQPPLTQTL